MLSVTHFGGFLSLVILLLASVSFLVANYSVAIFVDLESCLKDVLSRLYSTGLITDSECSTGSVQCVSDFNSC